MARAQEEPAQVHRDGAVEHAEIDVDCVGVAEDRCLRHVGCVGVQEIHTAERVDRARHERADALAVDLGVFDRTITVNLRGHLLCTRHAIPRLLERGGGTIVYTSSAAGHVGEPQRPSYGISKSGINALMRHVSSRWGREGIRANCVAPGMVLTKTIRDNSDQEFREYALSIGRSARLGEPEDIAAAVAFLLSDDASWITAQVISVDGGSTVRP